MESARIVVVADASGSGHLGMSSCGATRMATAEMAPPVSAKIISQPTHMGTYKRSVRVSFNNIIVFIHNFLKWGRIILRPFPFRMRF